MNSTCPDCGSYAPPEATDCQCGRRFQVKQKKGVPLYLAALPLIVPLFFVFRAMTQTTPVEAVGSPTDAKAKTPSCVETHSVTLIEDGKILKGTASNICSGPLNDVVLSIKVRDAAGGIGETGSYKIAELKPGVAQPFEHPLSARVSTWEITANK